MNNSNGGLGILEVSYEKKGIETPYLEVSTIDNLWVCEYDTKWLLKNLQGKD